MKSCVQSADSVLQGLAHLMGLGCLEGVGSTHSLRTDRRLCMVGTCPPNGSWVSGGVGSMHSLRTECRLCVVGACQPNGALLSGGSGLYTQSV